MSMAALQLMTDDARTPPRSPAKEAWVPANGELSAGDVLAGRHKIERWLANLPSAELYVARHATISTLVYVVKVLKREFLDIPEIVEQFRIEADAVSKLRSPFTVRVTDMGTLADGRPYLCREYYSGTTLDAYLANNGPLDELLVRRIAADVLASLAEAHAMSIVHRDIQPRGIILSDSKTRGEDGVRARVLDFGSAYTAPNARESAQVVTESNPSLLLASPQYTAPEVLRGTTLPASDIYALGLTLAELLDGTPAYKPDLYLSVATRQLSTAPPPLGERSLASGLAHVLRRATAKSLDERYASATEMLEDLLSTPIVIDSVRRADLEQEMVDEYQPHRGDIEHRRPSSAALAPMLTNAQGLDPLWERASALLDSAPTAPVLRASAATATGPHAPLTADDLPNMGTQRLHRVPVEPVASDAVADMPTALIPRITADTPAHVTIAAAAPHEASPTAPLVDEDVPARGAYARTFDIVLRVLLIIGIIATGLALLFRGLPG